MLARARVFALRLKICAMGDFVRWNGHALLRDAIRSPRRLPVSYLARWRKLISINKSGLFSHSWPWKFKKISADASSSRFAIASYRRVIDPSLTVEYHRRLRHPTIVEFTSNRRFGVA